jgi:cytochrome c biogenesis protein CcdA/thiol-disulfide isomerase/thioredoxin
LVGLAILSQPAAVQAQIVPSNGAVDEPVVHGLYFYAHECPHCQTVQKEILNPLSDQYGAQLDVRMLEIGTADNYALLIQAEERFSVPAEARGIPTLIIGDQILIGEEEIRAQLVTLIEQGLAQGGVALPVLPGLESAVVDGPDQEPDTGSWGEGATVGPIVGPTLGDEASPAAGTVAGCDEEAEETCDPGAPIWAAYFYQTGCQKCSRAETDIAYVRTRYPQLVVEEFNIYDHTALANWLAERTQRDDLYTPALFIGDYALIGESEITPQNLERVLETYAATGAEKAWADFDAQAVRSGFVERFRSLGPLTVVLAGLIDGLNPCAFATLVFFVSYLSVSGRKGKEVLVVGASFTVGVFLAYLVVGLGLYKVLDMLGDVLLTLGRWVYALTALLCAGLAVVSFLDFLKARRGDIGDMSLNLPHALRKRINAAIRRGRNQRAYVLGAFITGLVVSFLELACTGQIYLPTIIFVTSIPELRVQALGYLVLYNLLFILPLVVVFILAYYGTTSKDLTAFLQRRAAAVKLGMVVIFASLAVWLGASLVA